MKRILITGGAGFIGSNLCKRLVQDKNNYVIALDNLSSGHMENIQELIDNYSNFEFILRDIENFIDIKVDEIYNAACPASPPFYQINPVKTTTTCVLGILNMLELARLYKAKIVHFSTSEIYGDALIHPQHENYWGNVNPNGPRSCYDEGKRCAESLCLDYHRMYNVDVKIIRIFNTYGENMYYKDGRVISNFIIQALNNEDITIYGDGTQTRSFCYIEDLLNGIIKVMEYPNKIIVNLGNPSEFTILELASIIIEKTKSKSKIIFKELPEDDPKQRKPDISLAIKELNWQPKISLEKGLDKTIQYYKNYLN